MLLILLDDGWSAASSWDNRVRAADELIANADNSRRGIALVPLSEPARDITIMPAGAARVALRQLAPKPYSIDRVETLPAIERFLQATGDAEIAWLADGVDAGRGKEFVEGLGKAIGDRSITIFESGAPSPLALAGAENAAAKMTVKVLRTDSGGFFATCSANSFATSSTWPCGARRLKMPAAMPSSAVKNRPVSAISSPNAAALR